MKYIDLFAGIGGFRYGLESINKKRHKPNHKHVRQQEIQQPKLYTCVYSNEWDKYASQIYKKHYGECDTTDITKVKAKDIPDHDLLCAGFPCQAFSIAGKRRGFEDTRGTLFFEIARILSEKRPRLVLLENVKGLLNHDKGKTFSTILGVLSDLGYRVEWQVLNSKHFGVPQNRERVFIVGHLGGGSGRKVFPIGESLETSSEELDGEAQTTHPIRSGYKAGQGGNDYIRTDKPNTRQKGNKSDSTNSIRRTSYTDDMRIRRLTPTECERLQGFPDNWTEGISDTQRYKCLGNAVTTNVITAIGEKLNA